MSPVLPLNIVYLHPKSSYDTVTVATVSPQAGESWLTAYTPVQLMPPFVPIQSGVALPGVVTVSL
jgi:hypothetical protein